MSKLEIPWVRPELARPAPYRWQDRVPPGRPSRFDMNTLPRSPAYWPDVAARVAALESCSYPEATYRPLREALGRYAGFPPEQIVPGAGCDEILILCAQLAVGRGDTAIIAKPTYQMYAVATQNAGGTLEALPPRDGLALDLEGLMERAPGSRLVWLCSPNNPTGEEVPREVVAELCRSCPGLVVVDQAYVELGGEDLSDLVHEHENLVVARTLSKGFALASLRVGYALASPAIAGALDGLRPPGSLSLQSATAAELGVGFVDEMRADAALYAAERGRLRRAVERAGLPVVGEAGSYVTLRVPLDSTAAFDALAAQGLVVRTFGHEPLLAGVVRASIATPPEDDRLAAALAELAGRPAPAPEPVPAEHARLWGRRALVVRETKETAIRLRLVLDGGGRTSVESGLGFLDHMLHALAFHGMLDLDLSVRGDLEVDPHHTVEDCGIALGTALDRALGSRAGIRRFADARAPLDEALAEAVVDLSGRGGGAVELELTGQPVGGIPASLFAHALDALARHARMTLHLRARGADDHHVVEAAFKALALALRAAAALDPARADAAPSTKAVL